MAFLHLHFYLLRLLTGGLLSDNCKIFVLTDSNYYWLERPKTGKTRQYIRDHKNLNDILLVSTIIIDILVILITIIIKFYLGKKRLKYR